MGLWNFFHKKDMEKLCKEAYVAKPRFYQRDEDGTVLGVYVLIEDCDTIFPKFVDKNQKVEGKNVDEWKMSLISITKDSMIGLPEYFLTYEKLKPYIIDSTDDYILVRALTLEKMEGLLDPETKF